MFEMWMICPLMASKYRSRTEIIASLLEAIYQAGNQVTKTKLMYRTFLSYGQFKEYVETLVGNDLIEYNKTSQLFRITERGIGFLKAWRQIEEMAPSTIKPKRDRI